ncbi:LytTR family DNA-binding domain-containing protein [Herbaspirillum sp. SJZ107]|uniref:LytR/AlgR family response regulator transcription factor n=1 Tax=Herbaspirillum sp. SJZ107 TaxID=2572881 RepID=UPI001153CAC1|nr:response regulator [Herbaspirillum sp. SJZ107]TQK08066.1 LytTR family two component transcriptional regulator [Herbaspirillum sp. SJZ107]
MRLLIVDDERPARERLRRLLVQQAAQAGISAVDEAGDGFEALAQVEACWPDAIFLDIAMPELSGIELAASLPEPAPLVVFLTAHDRYALQAFEVDAIDYLLKPCDELRLQRALQRLRTRLEAGRDTRAADESDESADRPAQALPRLPDRPLRQLLVTDRGATRVVRVADIGWIETADNYVALHTVDGSPLLRQTLAGLLPRLGPGFVRCHRRAAIQLDWIDRILPRDKGDCELILRNGASVPCSRQYRETVLQQVLQRR